MTTQGINVVEGAISYSCNTTAIHDGEVLLNNLNYCYHMHMKLYSIVTLNQPQLILSQLLTKESAIIYFNPTSHMT